MANEIIKIKELSKEFKIYENPKDRVKEAINLRGKQYHKIFKALNNISFDVNKGETVGIIGTNGAGKSTLLKIITGVLAPTTGEIAVEGKVSALLELGAGFNQEYTGVQNIYLNGRIMGYSKKEMESRVQEIIDFAEIGDFIYQPVKTYSSGMFARLAFAVAINVEPDILIVDEALSVGDLFFQNKCFRKFEELKTKQVTILFVSHDISSVRQMCSRVLWIDRGVQKIFDNSDTVCDMYMDQKRHEWNDLNHTITEDLDLLPLVHKNETIKFPKMTYKENNFLTNKLEIVSIFVSDQRGDIVQALSVEHQYTFHIAVKLYEEMNNLIVGTVIENNKGIPIYDLNNYINSDKVIKCEANKIIEVKFQFMLPRIMKGHYIVSAAVAQGTQEKHEMLTWLHGVLELEIVNMGYNSSYIEIPAEVEVNTYEAEKVIID